ncbi:MAG: sulfurtransferase complex subunit TusC [Gammaproteobacteria bacterium]|nr:sulfurtransferase complex subunit TusC [Gammaproteobacteria bacterium]MDD9896265.1 sulfurtransferase complex subunit TusC [Gammaproteobacteria bacterium]MDD9958639.1 sulfurtransferase complex subunit TusC [Gammaproteobacteria bacterium]
MSNSHTFTFISRTAPYGSNRPQLCLDAALAAAVFEQKVNYIFMDDGVYQLVKHQDADAINSKTLGNALETLDLYGIQNVYVCTTAMKQRKLAADDLVIAAQSIGDEELKSLLENSNTVFNL